MKHISADVTAASNPREMPPTHYINFRGSIPEQSPTPARQPPIEPAKIVSGQSTGSIKSAEGPARSFVLPEQMSYDEIREASCRFGGGRSAGNRSLANNQLRQKTQR